MAFKEVHSRHPVAKQDGKHFKLNMISFTRKLAKLSRLDVFRRAYARRAVL